MAKDYFQDIVPPEESPKRPANTEANPAPRVSIPVRALDDAPEPEVSDDSNEDVAAPQRSIRNISMPTRSRHRMMGSMQEMTSSGGSGRSRWWLWGIAALCVVVLGAIALVAFRGTTVTVTPRSHTITFDGATTFTAFPAASAATGTLSYTVQTADFDDSEVVSSTGTVHASDKASGSVTVYNNYQTSPLKLIATTRFQSPDGHIFRTPSEIVIPGKRGTTPGQVTITVIADQPGQEYNVAAGKFTVPGLKSNATEYANVYAQSSAPMAGGFVGDKPGVTDSDMQKALSAIQARLEQKGAAAVASDGDALVLQGLIRITYSQEPTTPEAGDKVRIHESAHVQVPVMSAAAFAGTVSADVAGSPVSLVPKTGFAANTQNASSTLGTDPLQFTLQGSAQIVWKIDTAALQSALAGKDQSAFQAIVTQFPGIDEAHARIEPFWKGSFPTDPKSIKVVLEDPKG